MHIDARGKPCPEPLILVKKALRENVHKDVILLVDNEIAVQNVQKMASQLSLMCSVTQEADCFTVHLTDTEQSDDVYTPPVTQSHYIAVFNADTLGKGDERLGKQLLEGFIYSLAEQNPLPYAIICYNRGVFLTTTQDKTVEDLRLMQEQGVHVYSCGLCLDFYQLTDKLRVGEITNMYAIVSLMKEFTVISP